MDNQPTPQPIKRGPGKPRTRTEPKIKLTLKIEPDLYRRIKQQPPGTCEQVLRAHMMDR